jgi:hypothetical protein
MNFKEYLIENGVITNFSFLITEDDIQHEHLLKQGREIAKRLGVHYNGFWSEMKKHTFTDDKHTGTTFVGGDFREAQEKLLHHRKAFATA